MNNRIFSRLFLGGNMKKNLIIQLLASLSFVTACGAKHDSLNKPARQQSGAAGMEVENPQGPIEPMEEVLSFTKDILPIVQNRCSLCHNPSSGLPVWEDYETIFSRKDRVRARVFEVRDMPRGNATGMTDQERELMALWIDHGALFE